VYISDLLLHYALRFHAPLCSLCVCLPLTCDAVGDEVLHACEDDAAHDDAAHDGRQARLRQHNVRRRARRIRRTLVSIEARGKGLSGLQLVMVSGVWMCAKGLCHVSPLHGFSRSLVSSATY
jgi:hypothetical protein